MCDEITSMLLPSSPISLQSPQEITRNPLKTLLAKMSEMRIRMREKWSERVF
jgi:hypothetical protein